MSVTVPAWEGGAADAMPAEAATLAAPAMIATAARTERVVRVRFNFKCAPQFGGRTAFRCLGVRMTGTLNNTHPATRTEIRRLVRPDHPRPAARAHLQ
jgi:hypothetical protein